MKSFYNSVLFLKTNKRSFLQLILFLLFNQKIGVINPKIVNTRVNKCK